MMAKVSDIIFLKFELSENLSGDDLFQFVYDMYKEQSKSRPFIGGYSVEIMGGNKYYYRVELIEVKWQKVLNS